MGGGGGGGGVTVVLLPHSLAYPVLSVLQFALTIISASVNTNEEQKKRGRPGNEASSTVRLCYIYVHVSSMFEFSLATSPLSARPVNWGRAAKPPSSACPQLTGRAERG